MLGAGGAWTGVDGSEGVEPPGSSDWATFTGTGVALRSGLVSGAACQCWASLDDVAILVGAAVVATGTKAALSSIKIGVEIVGVVGGIITGY